MILTTTEDVHTVISADWHLSKMYTHFFNFYTHLLLYKSNQHTYNNYKELLLFFLKNID